MSALAEVVAAPGTLLRLTFTGGVDSNNQPIDDTNAAAFVSVAAQNGHSSVIGGYTSASIPYAGAGSWHINVWGNNQTRSAMPARWTGQVTTVDGNIIRNAQTFNVVPATPIRLAFVPGVTCRFKLSGLLNAGAVPTAGWTVQCTIIDRAGKGTVLLNAVAGVLEGAQAAHYDVNGKLYMLANTSLLVTLQVLNTGGSKVLAQEWLLTSQ